MNAKHYTLLAVAVASLALFVQSRGDGSESGFVEVPLVQGAKADEVLILGPNCNSAIGKRTRKMAAELAARDIPHRLSSRCRLKNPSVENAEKFNKVARSQPPVVIIGNWAKANPTADEVEEEFLLLTGSDSDMSGELISELDDEEWDGSFD